MLIRAEVGLLGSQAQWKSRYQYSYGHMAQWEGKVAAVLGPDDAISAASTVLPLHHLPPDMDDHQMHAGQRIIVRSPARLPPFAYYDCDDEPIGPPDPAIPRLCARSLSPSTSTVNNIYDDSITTKAPVAILGQVTTLLELEEGAEL
ncbi:hypothetical protein CFIO01_12491 [Colletotrichum fioriniae PJ7]|uniref:Uncharacterized protein n=1 Tax=Colletotrichum fioriniae PJ7 TaxID=1445577 RepID=A0A010RXA6_9PEZI|nr:hypothetical protein CFIO01_12491 [Colletotrichum fioriniae PJ7]